MKRREFLALLTTVGFTWSDAAIGQGADGRRIAMLMASSASDPKMQARVAAFRKGLGEFGYVEGQNVALEFRWAEGQLDRLPALAAELVSYRPAVIVAPQNTNAALAAKAATTTIPIIFIVGVDPVQAGLVASFNQPGGNVTGISMMNVEVTAKRVGILKELLPNATRLAVLSNPKNDITKPSIKDLRKATSSIPWQLEVLNATTSRDIDAAFAALVHQRPDALYVNPDILFFTYRMQILTLAARYAMPAMYSERQFAEAGGLMSYGPSFPDVYRQIGTYAGRILKGQKPADLPVSRPTKFDFVINLKTAKTLGLTVPLGMLAVADQVIE